MPADRPKPLTITRDQLIGYADEARRLAMDLEMPAAAVSAVREMGVLAGLRTALVSHTVEAQPQVINIVRFTEQAPDDDAADW